MTTPQENRDRVERRYAERLGVLAQWRAAEQKRVDAEAALRHLAALQERDRDFQAHGLDRAGDT